MVDARVSLYILLMCCSLAPVVLMLSTYCADA